MFHMFPASQRAIACKSTVLMHIFIMFNCIVTETAQKSYSYRCFMLLVLLNLLYVAEHT